jgi:hypothetical protein
MIEHRDLRRQLEIILLIVVILTAIIYGAWKAYPLISGPSITVLSPLPNEEVATTTFLISGKVARVKEITLQGRIIPIDTEGHFNELLVVQAPYTTIILTATDFYGKTITKTMQVFPKK